MKRILVCPLDWGLGHATRLSRLIDELRKDNDVIIAASGRGYFFLKQRYPTVEIIKIPGLTLSYSRKQRYFYLSIGVIFLKLIANCLIDKVFLRRILRGYDIDLIISDNRFCCYSKRVKTWYITHQLHIVVPHNLRFLNGLVQRLNSFFIKKYDLVLVPDFEDQEKNLSGDLSHLVPTLIPLRYIGPLSRFESSNCQPLKRYDIVAIVSGLEPSRGRLVDLLVQQLSETNYKVLIISGVVERAFNQEYQNIKLVSHLGDKDFCEYVKGAQYIIVRAGYSTIMDLVILGRTAIIIPTPGQTEQEYLAQYLHRKQYFYATEEENLNIINEIKEFDKVAGSLQKNLLSIKNTGLREKISSEMHDL